MSAAAIRNVWLVSVLLLSGCGAVRVLPETQLPPPLIEQLPVTVGVYFSKEFSEYVYTEERYGVDYEATLGPAHAAKLRRLMQAMFARVVELDDPTKAASVDPSIVMVLEPRFEEYAFLTPRDLVGDSYTVTIRYLLAVYDGSGERVDGYVFTGYGRQPASGLSGTAPLIRATQRAMRDAGAKFAVELPGLETVQRLIAGEQVAPVRSSEEETAEALGAFGSPGAPAEPSQPAALPASADAPENLPEATAAPEGGTSPSG